MDQHAFVEALGQLKSGERKRQPELVRAFGEVDADSQAVLLNLVAETVGSRAEVLDLLLSLIDAHGLAVPAIRRLVASDTAVDEVSQDVLVAVAESINSFGGRASFRTWLNGVARNQTLQYIRREGRRRKVGDSAATQADNLAPAMRISSMVARREVLADVLDSLPDHYRTAVVMRDIDRCSYEEIANELAVELNTVRSRISRGRALIASSIAS